MIKHPKIYSKVQVKIGSKWFIAKFLGTVRANGTGNYLRDEGGIRWSLPSKVRWIPKNVYEVKPDYVADGFGDMCCWIIVRKDRPEVALKVFERDNISRGYFTIDRKEAIKICRSMNSKA